MRDKREREQQREQFYFFTRWLEWWWKMEMKSLFDGNFSSISSNPGPLYYAVLVQRAAQPVGAVEVSRTLLSRSAWPYHPPGRTSTSK